ncbi:MAG: nuclear transport factor 2 family protein [Hyphomonadaceae bacterium]
MSHERTLRALLAAIEAGASRDDIAVFYHPEALMEVFPNRMSPAGARMDLAGILQSSESGQKLMARQRFDVRTVTELGDRLVAEFKWTGELAMPLGLMGAGERLSAQIVQVLEFEDGRIIRQRTYDCYDPA